MTRLGHFLTRLIMAFSIETLKEVSQVQTWENRTLGIMNWGKQNAYPQTIKNLIGQSPTANPITDRASKFMAGKPTSADMVVHKARGLTIADIVTACAKNLSTLGGFALHANYNLEGKIVSILPMDITNLRFSILDELNYSNKVGYFEDFGGNGLVRRTSPKMADKSKIKWFDRFNADLVDHQRGNSQFKDWGGQILYYSNEGGSSYPTPKFQAPINYVLADIENSILVRREASTGFMDTFLLKTTLSSDDPVLQSLEEAIISSQGSRSSGKVITFSGMPAEDLSNSVIESLSNSGSRKTSIESAKISNDVVRDMLIGAYMIPPVLVGAVKGGSLSGTELEDAYMIFNSITSDDRLLIESYVNRMLAVSVFPQKEIRIRKLKLDKSEEEI